MKILLFALQLGVFLYFNPHTVAQEITGEQIFIEQRCVRCHTLGRGKFVGPDLYKIEEKYSHGEIVKWAMNPQLIYQEKGKVPVNQGYPPMPPMNLSQSEAESVADYLTDFSLDLSLAEKGVIRGSVVNETSGKSAEDVEIVLRSYLGDVQKNERFSKVDKNGQFRFDKLEWDRSYELTLLYDQAQYTSRKMVFTPNQDVIELELPVFESTESDKNIFVSSLHIILYPGSSEKFVNVTHIYEFANAENTIYVGKRVGVDEDQRKTLIFNIPEFAKDINFISGLDPENVINEGAMYYDTTAFNPGRKNVVYSYNVPLGRSSSTVIINPEYKVDNLVVLAKKDGLKAEVEGLGNASEVTIENDPFNQYQKSNLINDPVQIIFPGVLLLSDYKRYIPVVLFLGFICTGLLYRRLNNSGSKVIPSDNEQILKEIARLDDLFELNGIKEPEYREKRQKLKNAVLQNDITDK